MSRIAILATDGFEQSELISPRDYFRHAGHDVDIVSLQLSTADKAPTSIKAWDQDDWGVTVMVDKQLGEITPDNYDALILPGGQMNPDKLRAEPSVIAFVQAFAKTGKPLAAVCHAPWLLIEAGLAEGRDMTSYTSIRTDLKNAGAKVHDKSVVIDGNLITSRKPDDLDDFNGAIDKALKAGKR